MCVYVCVCVCVPGHSWSHAGSQPKHSSMCKNISQQDAHEKKVKVFLIALFKKGYESAIQIPRVAAKPLVTHTTNTHISVYKKRHLTHHAYIKGFSLYQKKKFKLKQKNKKTKTYRHHKTTGCVCQSWRVREIAASLCWVHCCPLFNIIHFDWTMLFLKPIHSKH